MKKIVATTLIALGALSTAQAQYYGELAYMSTTVKEAETGFKVKPNALRATLGYEVNPNVAVETMIAVGAGSKKITDEDGTVGRFRVSNSVGVYVKPKFQISEDVEIFARLGVTRASIKATWDDGDSGKSSTTKFSYGVGTSYHITPKVSVNADYMHYTKNEGVTSRGFAIGVGYKF
jgi:outer membrane autotransporter protein